MCASHPPPSLPLILFLNINNSHIDIFSHILQDPGLFLFLSYMRHSFAFSCCLKLFAYFYLDMEPNPYIEGIRTMHLNSSFLNSLNATKILVLKPTIYHRVIFCSDSELNFLHVLSIPVTACSEPDQFCRSAS